MYYDLLIEWNQKINLTTIVEKNEVWIKHFIDSCSLFDKYSIEELSDKTLIDVGTGAGFPGIPLAIMCPDLHITLLDSLNKRIQFLEIVKNTIGLKNVSTIHGRAEDFGKDSNYREQYDFAVSRAVANLSTLLEYCTPFIKDGGSFISYKSIRAEDELLEASNAFEVLNCNVADEYKFHLPDNSDRSLLIIKKLGTTPVKYPRKAGMPTKRPL
jgi:16S rRNA (guanine527-N7)-methyltransferase